MSYLIILFLASSFLVFFYQSAIANTNDVLLKSKLFLLYNDLERINFSDLSETDKISFHKIKDIIKCFYIFLSEVGVHQVYSVYKERENQTDTFKEAKKMTKDLTIIADPKLREIYHKASFYISVSAFSNSFVTLILLSPLVIIGVLIAALKWKLTSILTIENAFYLRKRKTC